MPRNWLTDRSYWRRRDAVLYVWRMHQRVQSMGQDFQTIHKARAGAREVRVAIADNYPLATDTGQLVPAGL